jgi:WD40 repeat protein
MTIGPLTIGDAIDIKDNIIIGGNYESPGGVMLFDVRNMKKPMNVIKTMSQLYVCKYSKKDKTDLFACGGYKIGAMKLYKAKTCEEVGGIEGCFPVYSLDFSGNGNNIVYGNSDGGVRIVTV